MAERLEDVKPTRMELLRIRKRKVLAENGHDLLSEKKDALINEFFKIVDKRRELRDELEDILEKSFDRLIEAQMVMGTGDIESIADGAKKMEGLEIDSDNIMGVEVPKLHPEVSEEKFYGYADTSVRLDEAVEKFREALEIALELAEVEGKLNRLSEEIEKAKRRVNSLEYNYIPKLEATIKYIERQLEEREREDFFRRKKIKSMMEEES
ncbi:MAG: V-type ATP synthase subunit D [Candidatus Thermoplasmatota archaeon]|nr:V-type ATP synthase subunit D [Candidatus Thermoplasmatota archaeon]MBS3790321.1 V-type ATP synthase subunit D [Candidatus Thermoplasmatota archaeon]